MPNWEEFTFANSHYPMNLQNNNSAASGSSSSSGGGLFGNTGATGNSGATGAPTSQFGGGFNLGGAKLGGAFGAAAGGTGNSGTNTPAGGSLFGATNPTSTSGSGTSNSLFGGGAPSTGGPSNAFGGTGLFGTPKSAEQGGTAAKPAASNFFNQPTNTSAASASTVAPTGGLFGSLPKLGDSTSAPSGGTAGSSLLGGGLLGKPESATTAAPTGPSLFGGFSLGGNKDAPPAATTGGLFGNLGANKDKKDSTPAPAPTFSLFGTAKDTSAEKKDAPAAAPIFSLGVPTPAAATTGSSFAAAASKEADKPAALPSAATNAQSAIAVPPPSALRGKTIEDIVNKWSADLEIHVREFNKFAGEVAVWDRALIENGNNLAALYSHVLAAEREQNDVDQTLDHIEQQQKDLSQALETYEKSTQEILGQGGSLRGLDTGPADTERDKNYMLATDLHTHLDDLSGSLTQMIESVNALSLPSASGTADGSAGEDPMSQIAQILSSHLESLQWIDGAVREVEGKVTEVQKRVKDSGSHTTLSGPGAKSRGFGLNR